MTAPTVKFQEDPRDTRLLIVDAARKVLARDGAAQMTLATVAQEAGMPVEELSTHFLGVPEVISAIAADDLALVARNSPSNPPEAEPYASPLANVEQRMHALENAFADMVERHEKSLRERAGVVSWVEQSVNTLVQRLEASEREQADAVAELRGAVAASATLTIPASFDSLRMQSMPSSTQPMQSMPGSAQPMPSFMQSTPTSMQPTPEVPAQATPEFPPMSFGEPSPELPPMMTESMPAPAMRSPSMEPAASMSDAYLSQARRAAKDANQGSEQRNKSQKRTNRTRFLIAACIAPVVIIAVAVTVLNRHVVTAMPVASPPEPAAPVEPVAPAAPPPATKVVQAPAPLSPPPQVSVMPPTDPTPAQIGSTVSVEKLTEMATSGDSKSERDLGLKYLAGDGVDMSEGEAARWLMRAAYKGEPTAEYWLGTLYARGRGLPADAFQANHWYEAAAKQGNRRAMHSFAVAYFQGWGVEKNFAEAARWFTSAAELGYVDSQFNLAVLYERGAGVQQSLSEAYKWYAIAARAGDKEADSRVAALATQLAPGDLALAQQAASSFKPSPMNASANAAGGPQSSGG